MLVLEGGNYQLVEGEHNHQQGHHRGSHDRGKNQDD
jgi:hypothetical protein